MDLPNLRTLLVSPFGRGGRWARSQQAADHRMRLRFYEALVRPGELVFDVGANVGLRTEVFLAMGARVVAVEPQAESASRLRERWGDEPRFALYEGGCSDTEGERELFVSDADTLTTMSRDWIDGVNESGRFRGHRWDDVRVVRTTTLDALIAAHGLPGFMKIDVEGFELEVLRGLTQPVGTISIEWAAESLASTLDCVAHMRGLGMSEFNLCVGESPAWTLPQWVSADVLERYMRSLDPGELHWGDVYARIPEEHGTWRR